MLTYIFTSYYGCLLTFLQVIADAYSHFYKLLWMLTYIFTSYYG